MCMLLTSSSVRTRDHCGLTWRKLLQASRSLAAQNACWRGAGGGAFGRVCGVPGHRLLQQPHHPHHWDRLNDPSTGHLSRLVNSNPGDIAPCNVACAS